MISLYIIIILAFAATFFAPRLIANFTVSHISKSKFTQRFLFTTMGAYSCRFAPIIATCLYLQLFIIHVSSTSLFHQEHLLIFLQAFLLLLLRNSLYMKFVCMQVLYFLSLPLEQDPNFDEMVQLKKLPSTTY